MLLYLSFPEVEEDSLGRLALLRGDQVGGAHQHLSGTGGSGIGGVGQVEWDRWSGRWSVAGVHYLCCRLQLHLGHLEDTTCLLSQPPSQGLYLRYNQSAVTTPFTRPPPKIQPVCSHNPLHKASTPGLSLAPLSLQKPPAAASLAPTVSLTNPLALTLTASSPLLKLLLQHQQRRRGRPQDLKHRLCKTKTTSGGYSVAPSV